MAFDNTQLAIIFVAVIVILTLILNYLQPATLYEYVVTTGFGALVALAVPALVNKNVGA